MLLTAEERSMLAGDHGPGAQFGMRIIEIAANAVQAERLQKVTSAHVVDALMYGAGESGPDFAKMLRDMNARVAIPTTMNTGSADLVSECSVGPRSDYESARDVMRIFRDLGCATTYTCSPFQEPQNRLRFGEHVAWGESNAVVFANSVFGARTNRYGNVIDIAAALTGRVPYAGLHITENRRATVVVRLDGLPEEIVQGTYFYHVFGYLLGRIAGERITAITGVTHKPTHDQLKALGAAAASSGAIPMFHMVGVTPEAATLEDALQGHEPDETVSVTLNDLDETRKALSGLNEGSQLDAVCLGAPHLSIDEVTEVSRLIDRHGRPSVVFTIAVSRRTIEELRDRGEYEPLREAGVTFVSDRCAYHPGILDTSIRKIMTDSAKWSHYAPHCIQADVQIASLDTCVRSAVAGRVAKNDEWQGVTA
jgi:predicted aconitase